MMADAARAGRQHAWLTSSMEMLDVRPSPVPEHYFVTWADGVKTHETDHIRSAGPRAELWVGVVDRYNASTKNVTFATFRRKDEQWIEFHRGDGASPSNRCAFEALQQAMTWLGDIGTVTDEAITAFIRSARDNMEYGASWKQLFAFIRTLQFPFQDLDLAVLKTNLHVGSAHGHSAVQNALIEDGVYLVAASSVSGVRHSIAALKAGEFVVTFDNGEEEELSKLEWIRTISYIRRVAWKQ